MIDHDEAKEEDPDLDRLRHDLTEQPDAGLFVSDKVLFRRLGVGPTTGRIAVRALEPHGFPRKQPLFGHKRYWPAVRHFLDGLYGLVKRGTAHEAPETILPRPRLSPDFQDSKRRVGRANQARTE
jgi:hypothetical protein